jgi:hypothetical protein
MNAPLPPQGDDDVDRLLARQYRDTSPEFEARWTRLKRELRQKPGRPATARFGWRTVVFAGFASLAAVAVVMLRPAAEPPGPSTLTPSPEMAQVLTLALPLLDDENRLALLHLPVSNPRER